MTHRVTQVGVETLYQGGGLRSTQVGIETLYQGGGLRSTQVGLETLYQGGGLRSTQVGVEVLASVAEAAPPANTDPVRVTRLARESVIQGSLIRTTRVARESIVTGNLIRSTRLARETVVSNVESEASGGGSSFTDPSSLANLEAWFDASNAGSLTLDGNDGVTAWNDLSGNARHLGPLSAAAPTWHAGTSAYAISDQPIVRFTGRSLITGTGLGAAVFADNAFSVFWVQRVNSAGFDALWSFYEGTPLLEAWYENTSNLKVQIRDDANTLVSEYYAHSAGTPTRWGLVSDGSTITVYKDGVAEATTIDISTLGAITVEELAFGVRTSGAGLISQADLAEWFIYSDAKTAGEVADIDAYLTSKSASPPVTQAAMPVLFIIT